MKNQNSQTNQIKESLTSAARAIVKDEFLQLEFLSEVENNFFSWNQNLIANEQKIILPQIKISEFDLLEENLLIGSRAPLDMAACYLMFHDSQIHRAKNFSLDEQKLFDEFEKIRVIENIQGYYLGIVKNILSKIEDDVATIALEEDSMISLILLKQIFPKKILSQTEKLISKLERKISKKILQEIKNLAKKTSNQLVFGKAVEKIIEMIRSEKEANNQKEKEENSNQKNKKSQDDLTSFGQENTEPKPDENFLPEGALEEIKSEKEEQKISDLKQDENGGKSKAKSDKTDFEESEIKYKNPYKIFSSKFDEVIFPQKLVAKNELEILRDQLDLKLSKLSNISKKMSLKLKRKLLSKKNFFIERDSSRGVLDKKKLTRLVIDPTLEDIWINHKNHEYNDTALTILLDNSGSMRGNPIVMSALACEIIASILEKFSIKTEIIGFTTADWKGGRVRKMWENAGRPLNPGRLNELRHIIYKSFNQSFKKSKINLGLMLKEGILKENIDGEALLFARSRLMQQSEKRKILMVISDGTPVDDSTASANDENILSNHLLHVVKKIENSSFARDKIEVVGIGIGHSTDDFYKNSIAIRGVEELGDVMIEKIINLIYTKSKFY